MLYHSGPTSGQVSYFCQDAFVGDSSDYSGHLIRNLLNASETFHTEWFLQFWEEVKVWWAHVRTVRRVGKHLSPVLFQNFRYCLLRHDAARCRAKWGHRLRTWRTFLANLWTQNTLQKLSIVCRCYSGPRRHSACSYHFILVISHNHYELNFRLLARNFFGRGEIACFQWQDWDFSCD